MNINATNINYLCCRQVYLFKAMMLQPSLSLISSVFNKYTNKVFGYYWKYNV